MGAQLELREFPDGALVVQTLSHSDAVVRALRRLPDLQAYRALHIMLAAVRVDCVVAGAVRTGITSAIGCRAAQQEHARAWLSTLTLLQFLPLWCRSARELPPW